MVGELLMSCCWRAVCGRGAHNGFSGCNVPALWRSQDCLMLEVNLATLCFVDITRFTTVVSVCLYVFG